MPLITAVFDTNVIFQAVISDSGPAMACVQFVFDKKVKLLTTNEILDELRGVLARRSLKRKYQLLSSQRASSLLQSLIIRADVRTQPYPVFVLARDTADEVFVNLAIEQHANYLVTRDNDLLDLMKDSQFCSKFPELKIVDPVDFLKAIKAQ